MQFTATPYTTPPTKGNGVTQVFYFDKVTPYMKTVLLTTQTLSEIVSVKAGTITDYVQCSAADQTRR